MVSTITPGATGAAALGVDPRYARSTGAPAQPAAQQGTARGDRVEIGDAAQWASVRESVRQGLAELGDALAAGRDVYGLLGKISSLAQSPDEANAADDLQATLAKLDERVVAAIAAGTHILAGENLTVQAEPGAPEVVVQGLDLRLKANPSSNDAIAVSRNASLNDPAALAEAVQKSIDAVQEGMERFLEAARALDAHQGFLGAAAGAVNGVRPDLDADAARLMALQVRQGLDAAGSAGIANVEPQAVLALFRS